MNRIEIILKEETEVKPTLLKCDVDGEEYWSDKGCPRADIHQKILLRRVPMMHALVLTVVLLFVGSAYCQDSASYCAYMNEQAKAQADIYRIPAVVAGITQPPQGTPAQLYSGLSDGYAGWRKASETRDAARKNCELYKSTEDATLRLLYAMPTLEKTALNNRVKLIDSASTQLTLLLQDASSRVVAQDMTKQTLYGLESNKVKLMLDRSTTAANAAALYAPVLTDTPIRELIQVKQSDEIANQKALNRVTAQSDWDMTFEGGVRHQVSTPSPTSGVANTGTGGYATFIFNYNIGHGIINKHFAASAAAYGSWKENQQGDVFQNAKVLQAQILDMINVEKTKDQALQAQLRSVADSLSSTTTDTSAGLAFDNQLKADSIMLRVDIGDSEFRIAQLQQFLTENF